jgi:hypothetical protein
MAMDFDRLDAEPFDTAEYEFDSVYGRSVDSDLDSAYDADSAKDEIAPLLDNDDDGADEHADFGMYNIDVTDIVDEIWLDSAPPMHFSIEAGYFS